MQHFLDFQDLSADDVMALIQRALSFKKQSFYPQFPQHTLASLFYERSTRTRISFELAARHLGVHVVNFDVQHSSEGKGEVIEDTLSTLIAMGIQVFVVRHAENGLPHRLASLCPHDVHLINAGDGTHAHPTQAMLDLMTIISQKPDVKRLKIVVVGDVLHSRVAHSLQEICALLDVGELVFVAPPMWQPAVLQYGRVTSSLQDGMKNADVVMCLRMQRERFVDDEHAGALNYHADYGVTKERLACAAPDVMIMHPGPINRGMEIDDDVADGHHSFILEQVRHGVFMRAAIIERLLGARAV